MNQTQKNGTAPKAEASQQKDSAKGLAIIKELANPVAERTAKIADLQKKVFQIQKLKAIKTELSEYVMGTDDEAGQRLEIRDTQHRRSFETSNPVLIGKVVEFVMAECKNKIPVLEQELISANL